MTQRRHYPRFDTSVCPDPAECTAKYHGIGGPDEGDCCECCGAVVSASDYWTPGVAWYGAVARGMLTSPWPADSNRVGTRRQNCPHMGGHRSERTALACAERGARRGGWR